ncbi:SDR family oxidoreductase [Minwuia thermotolerans]|jgi:nucleoside-diphosphate-sugar epimerase|uniref:SDR family oxidoreductase n=1 Tax=Minwuia thermotolerans TaxID=2056226 RepID=UPI0007F168A0|nr:SDR family oxidoreductase [Minwuia thermotolerans]ANK82613.1 MAG: nucleoside-diphosphate sugar epimerase [Rhizobiales bacterium NRL2]
MARRKILIAGASGLVGYAAIKHFTARPDAEVIVVSRRQPPELHGARFIALDLFDAGSCATTAADLADVTHVVYAAVYEKPGLLDGWRERDHIETNARMLRNLMEPLLARNNALRHVVLLQGTKAYGAHVRRFPIPAREGRTEARDIDNFYWLQEDYIRERQEGQPWSWTIFRPQVIFGESIGSAMNGIAAIGVYAALLREADQPLRFPGGPPIVLEATDSGLLARAIDWAGENAEAANEVFNITNGDVFVWENLWPAIAETLGMEVGEPRRTSLAETVPPQAGTWDRIRRKYDLQAPPLNEFIGESLYFADSNLGYYLKRGGHAPLVSTVKLRQAGFHEAMHTEEMMCGWFRTFQKHRLLPPATDN